MNDKTELLQKLKALSDRGIGGEKINAEKMLNRLMSKYGISEAALSEDKTTETEFTYHGAEQRKLLLQIIYKVTNEKSNIHTYCYTRSGRSCRTIIGADVTAAQKIEIEFLFDFYVQQYEKERDAFLSAFIQKHNLFGELKPGEDVKTLTFEEMLKMNSLMNGMESVSPVRRLEAAK